MRLEEWVDDWLVQNLKGDLRYEPTSKTVTAHVPVRVVFHSSNPTQTDIAAAENWTQAALQKRLPGSKIKDRLSKRAYRREKGRRKNYLN